MSTSAKLRVLIAEDEVLVSMFLSDLVEDAGLEVVGIARTASEAVAMAQEHRPDIALMDAHLKGGSTGLSAAETLVRDQDIALIFISGDSSLVHDPAVAALKPVAVVEKPFMPDELTAVLQRAARLRNAA
jgi:CheY-like chemotaxis protein